MRKWVHHVGPEGLYSRLRPQLGIRCRVVRGHPIRYLGSYLLEEEEDLPAALSFSVSRGFSLRELSQKRGGLDSSRESDLS